VRLSYRHTLTHFWCGVHFHPLAISYSLSRTRRDQNFPHIYASSALFSQHIQESQLLRGLLHAQLLLCDVSVFIIIMYAACTHTHTHNAHNLYIILLSTVWLPVYFSEFHFFNTYIHLHKRHHRNAEQNAPLCLYFLAHIGSQRDLRSMCEKWANYFQAEQIVHKTKGRRERESWIIRGAARALRSREIWAQLFARYFLELFILRSLLFAFAITPLSLSTPQINYHRITWTLTYWLWFEYLACKSSQSFAPTHTCTACNVLFLTRYKLLC